MVLAVSGGLASGSCKSPFAPSSLDDFTALATRPTSAGGAPLVTFLGNAADCVYTFSNDASPGLLPAMTKVDADSEGRYVETPHIGSGCGFTLVVFDFTMEIYATSERLGEPLMTAVHAGPWQCCVVFPLRFYEHTCGPFPANLDPEAIAYVVMVREYIAGEGVGQINENAPPCVSVASS